MKKMSKKEMSNLIEKLKPYWKKLRNLETEHSHKVRILEKRMNRKVKPKVKLEFFYVDGEIVGIGAEDYSDRKNFPLIQDEDI